MIVKTTKSGRSFIVSDEDAERVSKFSWSVSPAHGYVSANVKTPEGGFKCVKLHRWLLDVSDSGVWVDHLNGEPSDNRRENLRVCHPHQNAMNQKPRIGAVSKFKGVSMSGTGRVRKWRANIRGRVIGHFLTEEEAAQAYDAAARSAYGDFAYLNFPNIALAPTGTPLLHRVCLHCGGDFVAKDARKLCCSKSCATLRWQKARAKSCAKRPK